MNREMNALMNHAEIYYQLSPNPVKLLKKMGKDDSARTRAWTLDEYMRFADKTVDTMFYEPFQILYWCGLRSGEMFALTPSDIDFNRKEILITKSYCKVEGIDEMTTPKTSNSVRTVRMPDFLSEELKVFLKAHRNIHPDERIFTFTHKTLSRAIHRFAKAAGVPQIRVHDLRHSYVSLLINNGFTAYEIGKSVGHGASYITYRYAHLFDDSKIRMAGKLDELYLNKTN